MNGYIVKGIGGFYYVKTAEGIVECKPRGIFRKQKITPVAGDEVTLETENGAAVIAQIAPRKNVFVRPPVANLDVLFLVASTTQPTPSTLVLDKLSAIAVDKGVQPVIVCTKGDLAEAEFLRSAYEKSTLPFIRIDYETGAGLDEVKQWITGRLCAFCGNSGVGKSTLLKLLSRITAPTEGEIKIRGRVASMLEVGTGFNNEMTGRENIYMNGAILGMTRAEIDAKLPQIIEFSECGDFIDTPVKRYSSGMFVKLAFAVAAHLDSEIMVMDEVLAVGDMKFQQKCLGKMSDVANQDGRTVLYVSHNMSTIRQLCTRCVVLDKGRVIFDGDVEQAIAVYMDTTDVNVVHYDLADVARMTGSAGKRFRLETLDFVGKESSVFADTEKMRVKITWRVSEPFAGIHMKMNLHARDSTPVGITHPVDLGPAEPGKIYTSVFEFDPSLLGEGQYFFYLDIFDGALAHAVCLDKPVTEFAFEVTNSDLTMPEWASGWGRIHFPPVKLVQE